MHYFGLVFLTWELSTPFLNMRKVMFTYGWNQTYPMAFRLIDILFALSFFTVRNVVGLSLAPTVFFGVWELLQSGDFPILYGYLVMGAVLGMNGLNTLWGYKIVKMVIGSKPSTKNH